MNINPVLNKEFRLTMRGWKTPITITVYLTILTLVIMFLINEVLNNPYETMISRDNTMATYITIAMFQFFMIAFIAPALTSGSISGERERQTLDLLLCTEMRPVSIILGKLFASISAVILLIIASMPLLSIVFLFGGITTLNIIEIFIFYIVLAITLGSIGIFFSTYFKRTTASNVVSYGTVLFLMFGTILLLAFYYGFVKQGRVTPTNIPWILYINPFAGFGSLLMDQFGENFMGISGLVRGGNKGIVLWQANIIINIALSAILVFFSARKLNPMKENRGRGFKSKEKHKKVKKNK